MSNIEIRFSGSGGQGLITAARILATALSDQGRHVARSQSYEPVSRGGLSRSDLVISDGEADFPLSTNINYLLILDGAAANESTEMLDDNSSVLVDSELVPEPPKGKFSVTSLPFTETARQLGNKRVANIVALGALTAKSGICDSEVVETAINRASPERFLRLNLEALEAGRRLVAGNAA